MKNIKEVVKEIVDAKKINSENQVDKQQSDLSYEQQQCEWYNASEGDLNNFDGIECTICKNKGYIQFVNESGFISAKRCECMERRKMFSEIKNSQQGLYINLKASDYKRNSPWQEDIYQTMVKYCKANNNDWFMICGQSGCGKTMIVNIITNYLLFNKNEIVKYITWTDFIGELKRNLMSDNANITSTMLEEAEKAKILVIDELLKTFTEADLKYIIEIINYRYQHGLKTIITSERSINDLLDIDEATFGRCIERCGEYLIYIPKDRSKNYRLRNIGR